MNIAILGGSFNPPQRGHEALVKHLSESGHFDEIWVIPCYAHPFQKKLANYYDRLEMSKLAFQKISPKVSVLNTDEAIQNKEGYSVHTLKYLTQQYPQHHFHFVMGSDLLLEKNKWKDFDKIEKLVSIFSIPRAGYESSSLPEISSTQIREKIQKGEEIASSVSPEVKDYIFQKGLYQ